MFSGFVKTRGSADLSGYVPYQNALADVELGAYGITGRYAIFTQTAPNAGSAISQWYNSNGTIVLTVEDTHSVWAGGLNGDIGSAAFGKDALNSTTTASLNVGIGNGALRSLTTGTENVAVGYQPLRSLTSGWYNVCIGRRSTFAATTAYQNVIIGSDSGVQITTGYKNTIVGDSGGSNLTDGSLNTIIGSGSVVLAHVSRSSALGALVDVRYDDCVVLGTGARATAANQLVIGSLTSPVCNITAGIIVPDKYLVGLLDGVAYKIPCILA